MSQVAQSGSVPATRDPLLHLFLVEDSAVLRDLLLESIAAIPGIAIDGFSDSEDDAFQRIQAVPCDIVIADIQLKQGNGIALLRRLAAQSGESLLVNIILSNNVGAAYRRVIEEFEVCFFFDKTTEFSKLHLLLRQLGSGVDARTL
jgi:DNA-binding NarL/FixJ family response regulator